MARGITFGYIQKLDNPRILWCNILKDSSLLDLAMAKLLNNKQEVTERFPRTMYVSPLPPRLVMKYLSLIEELERVKQRLSELENKDSGGKAIMLRDITREEAKEEIRQLFKSGRTLYFSDIADELALDLRLVVDICRELQESKEIGIDKDVLARTY